MRISIILLFVFFNFLPADAQILKELEYSTPQERAKLFSKEIAQHLMLENKQYELISAINLDHAFNIVPIVQSKNNKLAKLKKIKSLDKLRDKKLASVLTDKQFIIYLNHKKELIKNTRMRLKMVAND